MTSGAAGDPYDVAVVGAGHNGLVAAAYLARAGLSVLVLERLARVGGAAVTTHPFGGRPTRVSRYADTVALPAQVCTDLDLDVRLVPRPVAAYVPHTRQGRHRGLLVEDPASERTRASFVELTGSSAEHDAWRRWRTDVSDVARVVAPTLLQPLPAERDLAAQVDDACWRDVVSTPLADVLESRFADDTVRGLVAGAAFAGAASAATPSGPEQSVLLRELGSGLVPAGGAGALSDALARAAGAAGADIRLGAGVASIRSGTDVAEVDFDTDGGRSTATARFVLADVAPWVLQILLGAADDAETKPQGAQLKVNLLLDRLPRLRSGVDPEVAFAGDLHVATSWPELRAAHDEAAAGRLPAVIPATVTSPSLSDPSLLGEAPPGTQTLAVHAYGTPAAAFATDPGGVRDEAVRRVLAALDEHLVDPVASVLAHQDGRPCIEAWSPLDVEADLAMPGGHPHHGDLEWPWASGRARLETPDQQWGVSTGVPRVFLAGAGARRGGWVSGVAGQNAAQAVLAAR